MRQPGRNGLPKPGMREVLITFDVPISEKLSLDESVALISKQGYQRLLLDNEIVRLEEAIPQLRHLKPDSLTIIQDRIKPEPANRARFIEACEQAYHFGKGKLAIRPLEVSRSVRQALLASRCGSRTGFTARNVTSNIVSPPLPCSVSIIQSAPARPAADSGASSPLITTWRCRIVRKRWRKELSGRGRPGKAPNARMIWRSFAANAKFPWTFHSETFRKSGRTG